MQALHDVDADATVRRRLGRAGEHMHDEDEKDDVSDSQWMRAFLTDANSNGNANDVKLAHA